ncbi:MAG: hypothetical protein M3495_13895 [Pseudomonadota bacterium]|nr:hypothetical protein [Pseudomonadota bacterium]
MARSGLFRRAGIDPMLRPDTLAVADFGRLANELASAWRAGNAAIAESASN